MKLFTTYLLGLVCLNAALATGQDPETPEVPSQDPAPMQGPPAPRGLERGPSRGPEQAPRPGELPTQAFLDTVSAVIGEDLILRSDIERRIQLTPKWNSLRQRIEAQARRTGKFDDEAYFSLLTEVLVESAEGLLTVQGGRALGFDPGLVRNIMKQRLEEDIERFGGYSQMSRLLSDDQMTPNDYNKVVKDELMAQSWQQAQTGRARGSLGRFIVDREIRPGQLKAAYDAFAKSSNPVELAIVGIASERVVLQELILKAADYGGLDSTIALAESMREVGGSRSAFDDLVRSHGADKTDLGLLKALDVVGMRDRSLRRYGNEGLYEFAKTAEVDAVSPPFAYTDPRNGFDVVHIYRLDERLPAELADPFVDREVQLRITRNLQEALDKRRLAQALLQLERSSFVWPADLREYLVARRMRDL